MWILATIAVAFIIAIMLYKLHLRKIEIARCHLFEFIIEVRILINSGITPRPNVVIKLEMATDKFRIMIGGDPAIIEICSDAEWRAIHTLKQANELIKRLKKIQAP